MVNQCGLAVAGELVEVVGSSAKRYQLQRKGNVFSCSCIIWRSIDDIEQRRTCKHLQEVRSLKRETGRVGEEGIKRSEQTIKQLQRSDTSRPPSRGSYETSSPTRQLSVPSPVRRTDGSPTRPVSMARLAERPPPDAPPPPRQPVAKRGGGSLCMPPALKKQKA